MDKERLISVERQGDTLYLIPYSRTKDFLWLSSEPITRMPATSSSAAIGQAVLEALSHSGDIVPKPSLEEFPKQNREFLKRIGFRSWKQYHTGRRSIRVDDDGSSYRITPYDNRGSRKGFISLLEKQRVLQKPVRPEELGRVIQEALEDATEWYP